MTTVFSAAIDVLFTDPNLSVAATFSPGGAARIVWSKPDEVWHGLGTGTVAPKRVAEVRVSEIAAPSEGDTVAIDGTTYTIDGVPRRDIDGLVWKFGLKD